MSSPLILTQVMTKERTSHGHVYPSQPTEFHVKITKKTKNSPASISIYREKNGEIEFCQTFKVGDQAEYDSFNLSYYGEIVNITDKSVTIAKTYSSKKHRLDLNQFCWRNYNFDVDRASKENSETMMYI